MDPFLIELKSDKGEEESFYPHPNLYEIKLLNFPLLTEMNALSFQLGNFGTITSCAVFRSIQTLL